MKTMVKNYNSPKLEVILVGYTDVLLASNIESYDVRENDIEKWK